MTTLLQRSHTSPTPMRQQGGRQGDPQRSQRTLGRAAAFWLVTATTAVLLAASSAPSPLYAVYQAKFGFSALTLTAIFALYVLALLLSLLTVGRLSDYLGRRPVLAVALLVEAAAMAVFLDAHSVTALYLGRAVQGIATGAAVGVLGAYLLDLQPGNGSRLGSLVNSAAATGGLGLGAALTGILVEYAPHPTRLIFAILGGAFLVLTLVTAVLPETVAPKPGAAAALRPTVSVPPRARTSFFAAAPVMASTWMLGGLVFSVGGSVLAAVFGQRNHAIVGLVLGLFAGAAAISSIALRGHTPDAMQRIGTRLLFVGSSVLVLSLAITSLPAFVAGALIAGAGFGPGFLGAFRTVSQLAEPHQRAGLISAIYLVSYLAFSIPALVAGVVISHDGLRETSLGYGAVVAAVAALTSVYDTVQSRSAARVA